MQRTKWFGRWILWIVLFTGPLSLYGAERITYADYLQMSDEKKLGAAEKHVRRKDGYYVLDWGRYITHTDVSALKALEMTVLMDDFYNSFSKIFRGKFRKKRRPKLFVLSDQNAYATALAQEFEIEAGWSAGMFAYRGSKSALFANGERGQESLQRILFHEGAHQLLRAYIGKSIPVWFNEGMATNFECFELTRSPVNNKANALYQSRRIATLLSGYPDRGFVPFRDLITITGSEWLNAQDEEVSFNYATAWVTCNFFLNTKDGLTLMKRLLQGFRKGKKQKTFLNGKLIRRIEKKMGDYIESRVLPNLHYGRAIQMALKVDDRNSAQEILAKMKENFPDSPEMQFYAAYLKASSSSPAESTLKTLQRLDEDPDFDHPEMNLALALAYEKTGQPAEARRYARKALKGHSESTQARAALKRLQGR